MGIFYTPRVGKIQKLFLAYLREHYPEDWKKVLKKNPYASKRRLPGVSPLSLYLTDESFGDPVLIDLKRQLMKREAIFFGLLFLLLLFLAAAWFL